MGRTERTTTGTGRKCITVSEKLFNRLVDLFEKRETWEEMLTRILDERKEREDEIKRRLAA